MFQFLFTEKRPIVDTKKRSFKPLQVDNESAREKRDNMYRHLKDHVPNAVGVLYWIEEQKAHTSSEGPDESLTQSESSHITR